MAVKLPRLEPRGVFDASAEQVAWLLDFRRAHASLRSTQVTGPQTSVRDPQSLGLRDAEWSCVKRGREWGWEPHLLSMSRRTGCRGRESAACGWIRLDRAICGEPTEGVSQLERE